MKLNLYNTYIIIIIKLDIKVFACSLAKGLINNVGGHAQKKG